MIYPNPQIYHPLKTLFIHVPKTAGTSIERTLLLGEKRVVGGHTTAEGYRRRYPEHFDDYFKFAVVRHPASRFLSAYRYLLRQPVHPALHNEIVHECDTLDRFVARVEEDPRLLERMVHFLPQHRFVCGRQQEILVNALYRYELLETGWREVGRRIGRDLPPLPRINASPPEREPDPLTPAARALVWKLYEKDFLLFDYPMDQQGTEFFPAVPRRALVIGNGPSALCSEHYGSPIDHFDGVVVRFNQCQVKGREAFVGSRTDIWASCGSNGVRELGQEKNLLATHVDFSPATQKTWQLFEADPRPRESVSLATFQETRRELGSYPSSGTLVTRHLQRAGFAVSLHGFDFFHPLLDHHYFRPGRVTLAKNGHQPSREAAWFLRQIRTGRIRLWHPREAGSPDIESVNQFGLLLGKLGLTGRGVMTAWDDPLLLETLLGRSPLATLYLDHTDQRQEPTVPPVSEAGVRCQFRSGNGHFDDGELDLVAVGGRETDDGLQREIGSWLPKLRQSGLLTGMEPSRGSEATLQAIAAEAGRELRFTRDTPRRWWMAKACW